MRGVWALGALLITAMPAAAQDLAPSGSQEVAPASVEAYNQALSDAVFAPLAPSRTASTMSASNGRYGLEFTPQAETNAYGGANTGAELRVTRNLGKPRGDADGRYFLYASAARRSVETPANAQRWAGRERNGVVRDTRVGVGWRNGEMETSFGYVRRKVPQSYTANGLEKRDGGMVGFSLTYRPDS